MFDNQQYHETPWGAVPLATWNDYRAKQAAEFTEDGEPITDIQIDARAPWGVVQ